ncbi:hypothetical protein [Erwinia psidii]|uniref:Uncharacterized protein n=1 Tax=Erwinia psidii TaxID=69224 RepID=A0A3N6SHU5_9GAMM|nr:hypothetical protein [Erwinia psidii]MCX8958143.1 hypothetical protein [Erwinia psidii]RQM37126.1 hypothetical protein EB241_17150 [Erwinia psidii]
MRNYYATPADAIRPIAAVLEAAQYLFNDEYGKDLAHDLIAWAQETAVRATHTRAKSGEADNGKA